MIYTRTQTTELSQTFTRNKGTVKQINHCVTHQESPFVLLTRHILFCTHTRQELPMFDGTGC